MKTQQDLHTYKQAIEFVKTMGVSTVVDILYKIKVNDLEISDTHKLYVKYLEQLVISYNIIISRGGLSSAIEDYGNMIGNDEWSRLGTAIHEFRLITG